MASPPNPSNASPREIQDEFHRYREQLFRECLPTTENEHGYFERYAFSQFVALQAQTVEGAILAEILLDETNSLLLEKLKTISRYTGTRARSADRARKLLNELTADRHAAFIMQDIVTHAHNSDVTVPAAFPIHAALRPKDDKNESGAGRPRLARPAPQF